MSNWFANIAARFRAVPGHIWIALAIAAGTLVVGIMAYRKSQSGGSGAVPSGGGLIPQFPTADGSGGTVPGATGGTGGGTTGGGGIGQSFNFPAPSFHNFTDYAKAPTTPVHPQSAADKLLAAMPASRPYLQAGMTVRESRARTRADMIDPTSV